MLSIGQSYRAASFIDFSEPSCRRVEPELFPCLRKYGISFYEYNPRTYLCFTSDFPPLSSLRLRVLAVLIGFTMYQLVEGSLRGATALQRTKLSLALDSTQQGIRDRYVPHQCHRIFSVLNCLVELQETVRSFLLG
jgi:hypothetical protein